MKCRQCPTETNRAGLLFWALDGYCDNCYEEKLPQVDEISARHEMVDAAEITLNGNAAKVTGFNCRFARVTELSTRLSAEWSWEAIEHVIAKGGAFKTSPLTNNQN